jgi:hypothetical protein
MATRSAFVLILLAASCAAPSPRERDARALEQELAGLAAGAPTDCAGGGVNDRLVVAAPGVLELREGRTVWISRLDSACAYIEPTDTLIVDAHGSRYCRGDRVRGLEPGVSIPGPSCLIEAFTPYRKP